MDGCGQRLQRREERDQHTQCTPSLHFSELLHKSWQGPSDLVIQELHRPNRSFQQVAAEQTGFSHCYNVFILKYKSTISSAFTLKNQIFAMKGYLRPSPKTRRLFCLLHSNKFQVSACRQRECGRGRQNPLGTLELSSDVQTADGAFRSHRV